MQKPPLVIAVGQTWPDLAIEQEMLGQDAQIVDGRGMQADDPRWAAASGVLLGTAFRLDRERLARMPLCRGVVRYGIGYDNIDVEAAEELGVVVAIVRDYCIDEVAEHALACALSLARALPHWDRSVRSGAWRGGDKPRMRRLSALAFGIIGFGLIGRAVADKAKGLFGRILVHDPLASLTEEDRAAGFTFLDSLPQFLAEADIASVHVPLTEATRGLLDAAALSQLRPSASIINVSRGGIVDEAALLAAIRAGRLAGAALDTFEKEPVAADHPLASEPKILLSPHVAWLSEEAEVRLRQRASQDLGLVLRGDLPNATVTKVNTRLPR